MKNDVRRRGMWLFAAVATVALVNALQLCGAGTARWVFAGLQSGVAGGAVVCAVVAARRVTGPARWWRILMIGAITSWLAGELSWWFARTPDGTAPPPGVAAYFLPPVLSLAAMIVLARSRGGLQRRTDRPVSYYRLVAVIDGVLAAVGFSILVFIAGAGARSGVSLPRSQDAATVTVYSLLELVVVVVAMLMAMAYRRDRPYRANFLLLSGGVLLIAGSDRLVPYLHAAGWADADLWGGFGLLLGPLLMAFSLPEPRRSADARGEEVMDWVQSILPYFGFAGTLALLSYQLLSGRSLEPLVVWAALTTILLVTARQFVAMRAQLVLTRRLFDTQHRLAHQVHHDPLTGLPNRLLFAERLKEATKRKDFVLIFVDIDDFKDVNDQYGHAAGDELLCAVGTRLRGCVGPTDTLARIGGDEFALLILGEHDTPEVVADRLRDALHPPFAVHGSSLRIRASMGLVRPSVDDTPCTSDDLLRQADMSMYAGKQLGKDTAVVYRPSGLTVDFPSALRQADGRVPPGFGLVYQPIVTTDDRRVVAVEALARWTAPNGMQIPPQTFVAMAEGSGLGADLDTLVLDLACREVRAAGATVDIHVNIGAARLGNRAFEQDVARTLDRHGIERGCLVLEITETVPIVDLAEGAAAIRRFASMGVKVALDDFGAGYNSLTYLQALPVDVVKLDRGLAVGAAPGHGVALYRSVIAVCHSVGLEVIAEGIETTTQADAVAAAGCRLAQGYLFGRPSPLDELAELAELPALTAPARRTFRR